MHALTAQLLPHQQMWTTWAASKPVAANLSDLGTGKTIEALAWLSARRAHHVLWLTVAPYVGGTLEEIRRHSRYQGTDQLVQTGARCTRPGTIRVLSYHKLQPLRSTLALLQGGFDAVVADEAHALKRIQSQRTRAAIRSLGQIPQRLILTGTPVTNSLMDIWSIWLFLDGGRTFGRSYIDFRTRYFYEAGFEWKPRAWAADRIKELIRPHTWWCAADACLKLPPIIRKRIPVTPSPSAKRVYDELAKEFLVELPDGGVSSATFVVAKLMKMAQVLTGKLRMDDKTERDLPCSKRESLKVLLSHLFQQTRKLVIWCRFQHEVEDAAEATPRGVEVFKVAGLKDPTSTVAAFQNASGKGALIATLAKGAKALTFTAADTVVYYNRTPSVDHRIQSRDRTRRIGSERHARITYYDVYTKGTLEEADLDALTEKVEFANTVMDRESFRQYLDGKRPLIS